MAPRPPHFPGRAKRVLHIFCTGAVSHLDTWDYKPELLKRHGQPMPGSEKLITFQGENGNLARSPWAFRPRGECGKYLSDLLPHLAERADDLCFIHSLTSKTNTHGPGEMFMSTGFTLEGFPSMGAWVSYALGTEDQDLPAYVAIPDPRGDPQQGPGELGQRLPAGGLPGDRLQRRPADQPPGSPAVDQPRRRRGDARLPPPDQRRAPPAQPGRHRALGADRRLRAGRPDAVERPGGRRPLAREPRHAEALRPGRPEPAHRGVRPQCLLARRLLERGVRFVTLFNGAFAMGEGVLNWDGHRRIESDYNRHGPILDKPAAALLIDLKARGLLEDTLVVWTTEFGRMPTFQKGTMGRDHNPKGFTAWLAGAGVKRAFSFGATDEFGYQAVEKVVDVHDFHATILHLLGLDHERLTYNNNGTSRRLTDVHGHVIREVLA